MNKWNYDTCVWHSPTFDICPNFLCKEIRFWNEYPPTFHANILKICSFFSDSFPNCVYVPQVKHFLYATLVFVYNTNPMIINITLNESITSLYPLILWKGNWIETTKDILHLMSNWFLLNLNFNICANANMWMWTSLHPGLKWECQLV